MCRCTPADSPPWARNRVANSDARSASGPSAVTRLEGAASIRSEGEGIAAPRPPKQRPSRPLRSSTPKWSRAGASTKMLARSDILSQKLHGFQLPGSGRLFYYDLQSGILLADLFRW